MTPSGTSFGLGEIMKYRPCCPGWGPAISEVSTDYTWQSYFQRSRNPGGESRGEGRTRSLSWPGLPVRRAAAYIHAPSLHRLSGPPTLSISTQRPKSTKWCGEGETNKNALLRPGV